MLIGGGALVLLIVAGGFLWWQLGRESGDETLRLAEADYEAGSYGQAIDKFDRYLERFPDHKDNSLARVHRGLAQIRQAEQSQNWPRALEVTNRALEEISSEAAFGDARNELAAVLPKICAGLAEQAREQPSEEIIASARDALALVEKFVIKSLRPTEQLEETTALLARAQRDLGRDNALAAAVAAIDQAVGDGDTELAYETKRQLLRAYPDLQDDATLRTAVLAISASMKDAVTVNEEVRDASSEQPPPATFAAKAILSSPDASSEESSVRAPITAMVRGSVFGLDGATGNMLWHRFIGRGNSSVPIALRGAGAGDFLTVDTHRQQLLRLDGRTGEERWRQPLAANDESERVEATLSVVGDRAVTAGTDGALTVYDVASGQQLRQVVLPQALRTAPAASEDGATVYVVAEHSNMFVLGREDGQCHEVFYLGHEPGTVRIPPLVLGRYVVVAENHRLDDSRLRILLASEDGTSVEEIQQVVLQGHVTSPPVVSGGVLFVVTDLHAVNVFEVQPPGNSDPFARVLNRPANSDQHMFRFAAVADGQLLVADERLTFYDVRATGGRLPPKATLFDGHRFLQPPRVEGDTVLLVHQPHDRPGAIATAIRGRDGEVVWSTRFASPVADDPFLDEASDRLLAATANGSVFAIDVDDSPRSGVIQTPLATVRTSTIAGLSTTTKSARVAPDRFMLGDSNTHKQLLLCDLAGAEARLRWLNLPAPLGGAPCVLSGGVVAPGEIGQVFWLDAESGSPLASPFQTTLEPGAAHRWHVASLEPSDSVDTPALIISDDSAMLYRVGIAASGQSALAAKAERELDSAIARGFAVSGTTAFAVDQDNRLIVIDTSSLDEVASHALDAAATWGPRVVGDLVLIATDNAVLAFSSAGAPTWARSTEGAHVVGATQGDESDIVLGFNDGRVRRISPGDGKTAGEVDLDRPLVCGPTFWRGRAVVAADDGTVYAVDLP